MSLTFKLLSLAIRTAAKPIGNYIKRQAKEHDGFRRFAVAQAQRVHRIDMRMRLGILHDPEAQQRMHDREQKAAEEKKRKEETPIVRNEEEQRKYDEERAKEAQNKAEGKKAEEKPHKVKIRPLSEARAIELGANFFSETFIFAVAAGLLIWDSWRSRKKESQRRDDVADRLEQLESEVESLRAQLDPDLETLHDLSQRIKEAKQRRQGSWWNPMSWGRGPEDTAIMEEGHDYGKSQKQEEDLKPLIPVRKAEDVSRKDGEPVKITREMKTQEAVKRTDQRAEVPASAAKADEEKETEGKAASRVDAVPAASRGR